MAGRWARYVPLTGVIGVILIVVAFVGIGGNTPSTSDPATKFASYYHAHRDRQMLAALVLAIGATFLVFFGAWLREFLGATATLARASYGGVLIAAAGFYTAATIHVALADSGKYAVSDPAVIHAIGLIDSDFFIPFVAGLAVMLVAAGISLIISRALPLWFGIVSVVIAVATFTPAGFFTFAATGLWIIVVGIWAVLRTPSAAASAPA